MLSYGFAEKVRSWGLGGERDVCSPPDLAGIEERAAEEGASCARSCQLDELPGVAFGFVTLAYIVGSLISLL